MKNNITKMLMTLAVLGMLGATALINSAMGQDCCQSFPTNTVLNAAVTVYPNWNYANPPQTTPQAWWAVDVTDPSSPIPPGVYPGWCVDETYFLPALQIVIPGIPYSGKLISTCDPIGLAYLPNHGGTPPVGPPPIVSLATWHEVNYILNHKTGYYWWNVQVAINRLVGGPAPNDPLSPTPLSGYPPVNTSEVDAILADANANAATWTLPCGGTIGVIYEIPDLLAPIDGSDDDTYKGAVQIIILEVPCVCPPKANCVSIDNAVQGVPITPVTMVATGGCGGPYTFSASGLPAALTMSPSGTISGTPSVSGTFPYTVTITDKCNNSGAIDCSVTVNPPPSVTCSTISDAIQGVAITPVQLAAAGGCGGPYSFSASGLPTFLTISSSGVLSGTPNVTGTFPYSVIVTDNCGNKATNSSCSITVFPPPTTSCVTISNAVQGVAITPVTMTGSGGCGGPYRFSATGLPAGLSMDTGGTISGTPTVNGTFSYTVTVTDVCGNTGTFNCSVTILPPPPPGLKLFKSASQAFVPPGTPASYTYVVTNTGGITISNITVVDDNGTPGYTNDDFIVGTIVSLPPGGSQTFTKTVLLPQQMCEIVGGTNLTVGTVITTVLPTGDIQVTYIQSAVNDNRYGTGATAATGWASGHKFSDLTGSDKAEFRFTDSKGNIVLDGYVDYISQATSVTFPSGVVNFPSGYGCLGLGGDGGIVSGAASNFLFCTTSFSKDLNTAPFTSGYTVNSPTETPLNSGISSPAGWDYNNSYTVIVSKKAFGTNGFGGVSFPLIHNSPAKLGSNAFTPTNCNTCIINQAIAAGTVNGTIISASAKAQVCIGTPPPCNAVVPCTPPYPFASTNALTSIVFNEPECLVTNLLTVNSNCQPTQVQVFYNDEHAMTLGIRQLVTKTKVGKAIVLTTNANYVVTPLGSNPGSAINPATGATVAQGGVDVSGRPIFPAMFVTDVTTNPASLAGDWQSGGKAQPPTAIFGTWKGAVATIDQTVTPNAFTVTPDADPAKNSGWNLGPGSDPYPIPKGLADQGYSTEVRWDIASLKDNYGNSLQSGHTYRLYYMVHDGDQNKAGGDCGHDCGYITIP